MKHVTEVIKRIGGRPITRTLPNVLDPLSEPTIGRRLWAAYLRAGYTRASFSRALGVSYPTVDKWDIDRSIIDTVNLMEASQLVGYTMDELCFGRRTQRKR
jgi:hypothetical protein